MKLSFAEDPAPTTMTRGHTSPGCRFEDGATTALLHDEVFPCWSFFWDCWPFFAQHMPRTSARVGTFLSAGMAANVMPWLDETRDTMFEVFPHHSSRL